MFRLLFVMYIAISLIGCVTAKTIRHARENAETETVIWNLEGIKFAAIRENRYVRICLQLTGPKNNRQKELRIDLKEIAEQFNNQEAVTGELKDEYNTRSSSCSFELEENEKSLSTSVSYSDGDNISEALRQVYQEPMVEPTVTLLHHGAKSYLVFGAPEGIYESLDSHALDSYKELNHHYGAGYFVAVPLAVFADAAIITIMIGAAILCVFPIFLPLCVPLKIIFEGASEGFDR